MPRKAAINTRFDNKEKSVAHRNISSPKKPTVAHIVPYLLSDGSIPPFSHAASSHIRPNSEAMPTIANTIFAANTSLALTGSDR